MATVYKILSPCLQECYVGSTKGDVEYRWRKHRSNHHHCRSKNLFEKYGYDNCKFVVLEVCPLEERREKEQWWMDHSAGLVNKHDAIYNTEKKRINDKTWREANKERLIAYHAVYREENKEKKNEYMRRYREAKKASE